MTNRDWAIIFGLLSGVAVQRFVRERINVKFIYESPSKDYSEEMLFDCPACGLPSELDGILTQVNELTGYEKYFVLSCFGDHDQVAASEDWFRENVGRM